MTELKTLAELFATGGAPIFAAVMLWLYLRERKANEAFVSKLVEMGIAGTNASVGNAAAFRGYEAQVNELNARVERLQVAILEVRSNITEARGQLSEVKRAQFDSQRGLQPVPDSPFGGARDDRPTVRGRTPIQNGPPRTHNGEEGGDDDEG